MTGRSTLSEPGLASAETEQSDSVPLPPRDSSVDIAETASGEMNGDSEPVPFRMAEPADPMVGVELEGRYRLEEVIGSGGVGVVYGARHLALDRPVAIKLLRDGFEEAPIVRGRFEREARLLSELSHPHIVGLADYGMHDGVPYLVMERLEGQSLEERLADAPVDPAMVVDMMRPIVRALAFAHEQGILHRDLKPGNVFLQQLEGSEHAKLLDFGLAKLFDGEDDSGEFQPTLTRAGTVLGTPAYMAPEQASGLAVGPRADVYSAGVMLFEMLAGRPPFLADRRTELMRQHMLEEVPNPALFRAGLVVSPALEEVLQGCLAKDPAERFEDGAALLSALDDLPFPAAALEDSTQGDVTRTVARRTLRSPESPTESQDRLKIIGAVVALLAAVVAGAWLFGWGAEGEGNSQEANASRETRPPTPPEQPFVAERAGQEAMPPPSSHTPPIAPSAEEEREFAALLATLAEGDGVDRDAHRAMRIYQRLHPQDPRPTLALAHDLAQHGAWSAAVERYALAHRRWTGSVQGDAMLDDLFGAYLREDSRSAAAELIVTTYGPSALPLLTRRLAESESRPTRQVYRRLQTRLQRMATSPP